MKSKIAALILSSLSLTACFGGRAFQPNPPAYKTWEKSGVSEASVKKIMLECGFSNSVNNGEMDNNSYALAQNCMFKKGFRNTNNFDICTLGSSKNLPACKKNSY